MTIFWRPVIHVGLVVLLACVTARVTAQTAQLLEDITSVADLASQERAAGQGYNNVSVEVRPLDKRLRLPKCSQALSTLAPTSKKAIGAVTIGVRCTGVSPWTIYVRTSVTARQSVPVLARPLARHAIVSSEDIKMVNQPIHSVANGVIYDPDQIIGMELLRPLDLGSTIKISQVRAPKIVKNGQQVTIISSFSGLDVRMLGKALKGGAVGERITVSNLSSGKRVEGVVYADGTVRIQ